MNQLKIDQATIHEWKAIFERYHQILAPNRRSVKEILNHLKKKYPLEEDLSDKAKKVVELNLLNNYYINRLSKDNKELEITVYKLKYENAAKRIYDLQSEIFKGIPIMIGAESKSGYLFVEGSNELADEITLLQGLDSEELKNYYLVANYIRCLQNTGELENIFRCNK